MKRAVLLLAGVLCACASSPPATDAAQTQDTAAVTDVQTPPDTQSPPDATVTDAVATDAVVTDVATTDTAPPVDAPAPCLPVGNATRGAAEASDNCASCHGATLGGGTNLRQPPGANLHNDGTGAGGWTDCDFQRAVRSGVDDEGAMLCVDMPQYTTRNLSNQQLADIFAYVQTLTDPGIDPGACQ